MTQPEAQRELKKALSDFIADGFLPAQAGEILRGYLGGPPNPQTMEGALEAVKAKVRKIIDNMPNLTSQAFFMRIPSPDFLDMLLVSEYMALNSVNGEKSSLRYERRWREPAQRTLALCLGRLGFSQPADLEPYRRALLARHPDGEATLRRMAESLDQESKEN